MIDNKKTLDDILFDDHGSVDWETFNKGVLYEDVDIDDLKKAILSIGHALDEASYTFLNYSHRCEYDSKLKEAKYNRGKVRVLEEAIYRRQAITQFLNYQNYKIVKVKSALSESSHKAMMDNYF